MNRTTKEMLTIISNLKRALQLPDPAGYFLATRGLAPLSVDARRDEVRASRTPPTSLRIRILMPRTDVGGGARILFEHANRLAERGHDVATYAHSPEPDWFDLDVPHIQVPTGRDLATALDPCDLIVCGYWQQIAAARALDIAPVVHFEQGDFHLFEDLDAEMSTVVSQQLDAADVTTTVSSRVADILDARYRVTASVIHNAVDERVFKPSGPRHAAGGGRPYMLCVGWDGNEFKGLYDARRAHQQLQLTLPDLEFIWVSPRPVQTPYGTVIVAPTQRRLAALYRGASAYLCASRYESFPLPPLEAMACGTPVITTDNPGVLEYAVDRSNALVVPREDWNAMTKAILEVLSDDDLAANLTAAGHSTARSFAWNTIIGQLEATYRDASHTAGPPFNDDWTNHANDVAPSSASSEELLAHVLSQTSATDVLLPVSRPAFDGHRIVSWERCFSRPGPRRSSVRVHAVHSADGPATHLPYYSMVEDLVVGRARDAVRGLAEAFSSGPEEHRSSVGRWLAIALHELDQSEEALAVLSLGVETWPDHPDYVYLLALVAKSQGIRVNSEHAQQLVDISRGGWRHSDWFEDTPSLMKNIL